MLLFLFNIKENFYYNIYYDPYLDTYYNPYYNLYFDPYYSRRYYYDFPWYYYPWYGYYGGSGGLSHHSRNNPNGGYIKYNNTRVPNYKGRTTSSSGSRVSQTSGGSRHK